jgi:hypothetical protein
MSAREFFQTFAELLEKNPPHPQDAPLMKRLARIGIIPGKGFQAEALGEEGLKVLEEGAKAATNQLAILASQGTTGDRINGWTLGFSGAVGRYGTRYQARAEVARLGLGARLLVAHHVRRRRLFCCQCAAPFCDWRSRCAEIQCRWLARSHCSARRAGRRSRRQLAAGARGKLQSLAAAVLAR